MKNLIALLLALPLAGIIILLGLLAACMDNWMFGVLTGIGISMSPKWFMESLEYREKDKANN